MNLNNMMRILARIDNTMPLTLEDDVTKKLITIHISRKDYKKAKDNPEYANELLNKHKALLNNQLTPSLGLTSQKNKTQKGSLEELPNVTPQEQQHLLFTNEIGGPMLFTFHKLLNIERNQLKKIIEGLGGRVVDYGDKNEHTIVLTKKFEKSNNEIQFSTNFVKDCKRTNQLLPLEDYRLDKKVKFGCYFSQPLDSKTCVYSKLIQQGKCKKHSVSTGQNTDLKTDDEDELDRKFEYIKKLVYIDK